MTINTNAPLQLSDGTPVTFVKVTSKGNIQVRVPAGHPLASDPLRIFRTDGSHYKDQLNVYLVNAPAGTAPASNDTFLVGDAQFYSFDDAQNEALDWFRADGDNVTIYKLVPVATVGVTKLAA